MRTNEDWLRERGFVPDGKGAWHKPKRTVPIVCEASSPKPESAYRKAQNVLAQREAIYSGRVLVCVTSYRVRLCDEDNLLAKYFVDCCRYSRLIRDDCPNLVRIVTKQERVSTKAQEGTEVVITPL